MYKKTLGKENAALFTSLASQGKMVFSMADAQQVTGKGYQATLQALHRLVNAGWLVRLGAGKYAIVPPQAGGDAIPAANRLVIGRELVGEAPYYLSHDSALEVHNLLTRPVTSVTITTPRRLKPRLVLKVPYLFISAKQEDMWGYVLAWVSPEEQVQVSDPERTILDGLARPDLCGGITEIATALQIGKAEFDWSKLVTYAQRLGNQAVMKRLGYLLELFAQATPAMLASLQEIIGPSYARLDPLLPEEGKYLARWRVQLNLDPDMLKELAST